MSTRQAVANNTNNKSNRQQVLAVNCGIGYSHGRWCTSLSPPTTRAAPLLPARTTDYHHHQPPPSSPFPTASRRARAGAYLPRLSRRTSHITLHTLDVLAMTTDDYKRTVVSWTQIAAALLAQPGPSQVPSRHSYHGPAENAPLDARVRLQAGRGAGHEMFTSCSPVQRRLF
jgi:hypothetical protein